jgi:hypothetical protein
MRTQMWKLSCRLEMHVVALQTVDIPRLLVEKVGR